MCVCTYAHTCACVYNVFCVGIEAIIMRAAINHI